MVYEGVLTGNYVFLKSCEIEDAEFTLRIRSNPAIENYIPIFHHSLEEQIDWIRQQRDKEGDYFFVIFDRDCKKRLGTVGLYDIECKKAEFGRLVCEGGGHGCAMDVINQVLIFAFRELALKKVTCFAYEDNERAIRLYRKAGFTVASNGVDNSGKGIVFLEMLADSDVEVIA